MGKLYAKQPSAYMGIDPDETWMVAAIDLACTAVMWEDENHRYKEAQKTAGNEAAAIQQEVENYKRKLDER